MILTSTFFSFCRSKLAIKNLLPRTKIELSLCYRHHDFPPHDLPFKMGLTYTIIFIDNSLYELYNSDMEIVADASAFLAVALNEIDREWVIEKTSGCRIVLPGSALRNRECLNRYEEKKVC